MLELNELLVPVDFSEASRETFRQAQHLLSGEGAAIILLHAIDPALVDAAARSGLGSRMEVAEKLREHAETELAQMVASVTDIEVVPVISQGVPFYEIVRHAEEFAVDAVVLSRNGTRGASEALFFGSTAERVVRACRQPVIVLTAGQGEASD
jgi:nucleotide-binding universal stress UspA family protein